MPKTKFHPTQKITEDRSITTLIKKVLQQAKKRFHRQKFKRQQFEDLKRQNLEPNHCDLTNERIHSNHNSQINLEKYKEIINSQTILVDKLYALYCLSESYKHFNPESIYELAPKKTLTKIESEMTQLLKKLNFPTFRESLSTLLTNYEALSEEINYISENDLKQLDSSINFSLENNKNFVANKFLFLKSKITNYCKQHKILAKKLDSFVLKINASTLDIILVRTKIELKIREDIKNDFDFS